VVCPKDATPLGIARDPADPLIGVVLAGAYRITRVLAKGGMGRLYEAEHTRLPRRFAIKVIHEQYARCADAVARFEREARAVASIDSDHVVCVFDVVRTPDDRPCIVSERLDGEDLQARLDRAGRLPVSEAVSIARQMCRGLGSTHARGVVHRDLKPSNVFLTARSHGQVTVKILDFGVAKLSGAPEITKHGAIVGTPAYMAPEQARGAGDVDERADVYGVGAVLYRMIAGHAPFEAHDATASLARVLNETARPLRSWDPAIPVEVEQVVTAALSADPDRRPASVAELESALRALDPTDAPECEPASPALRGRGQSESTLVLPRGAVAGATADSRGYGRSRRHATALLVALCATAGAGAAILLASLLLALTDSERPGPAAAIVIALGTVAAMIAAASGALERLRPIWRQGRRLSATVSAWATQLRVGLSVFGALVLGGQAVFALWGAGPTLPPALSALVIALAAGAMAAASLPRRAP